MTRKGARATLVVGSVAMLALSACKSFTFELNASDPSRIHSVFVIVDAREKLEHGSPEAIKNLARPERYDSYPFFAQFLPEGNTWQAVDLRGHKIKPEIDGERIRLKFPRDFIELQQDPLIAVVVRFVDNSWRCETDPLVLKGEAEYVIGATQLVAQR